MRNNSNSYNIIGVAAVASVFILSGIAHDSFCTIYVVIPQYIVNLCEKREKRAMIPVVHFVQYTWYIRVKNFRTIRTFVLSEIPWYVGYGAAWMMVAIIGIWWYLHCRQSGETPEGIAKTSRRRLRFVFLHQITLMIHRQPPQNKKPHKKLGLNNTGKYEIQQLLY